MAILAYAKRKQEISEGKFVEPRFGSGPTLRELAGERMERMKKRLRPNSLRTDRQRLGQLLAAFGDLPYNKITADMIGKFMDAILDKGRSAATANRYLWLLRAIFSDAVRHDRIPSNPCAKVKNLKESTGRVRYLSDAEEDSLRTKIRELYPAHEPDFDLALHTGMRRGEQAGLKWTGVDMDRRIPDRDREDGPAVRRYQFDGVRGHREAPRSRR